MLGIGVDFGTSNSSVALFDGETLRFATLEPDAAAVEVMPSALYLDRGRRAVVGQRAVETYLRENAGRTVRLEREDLGGILITSAGTDGTQGPKQDGGAITVPVAIHALTDRALPGRLFRGLKRWLGDERLDRVQVFGGRYRIVALVTPILARLAGAAAESAGSARAYVGRPIRFEGPGERANDTAVRRLGEACGYAGFGEPTLYPEPVAAALSFLHGEPARGIVLAFDFGGGTLDLTVLRSQGAEFEILATHGTPIGGDEIDRCLYREVVFPELGSGAEVCNAAHTGMERFPFREFADRLLNWPLAYELNRPDLRELVLTGMREGGATGERLGRLLELISRNQSYRVFQAIERAKLTLSDAPCAHIEVPELDLRISLERPRFERAIAHLLDEVDRTVEQTLARAGLEAAAIDVVVRTGGSSQIPAVRERLEARFAGRVVAHRTFTGIAAGLALASYHGYRLDLRADRVA